MSPKGSYPRVLRWIRAGCQPFTPPIVSRSTVAVRLNPRHTSRRFTKPAPVVWFPGSAAGQVLDLGQLRPNELQERLNEQHFLNRRRCPDRRRHPDPPGRHLTVPFIRQEGSGTHPVTEGPSTGGEVADGGSAGPLCVWRHRGVARSLLRGQRRPRERAPSPALAGGEPRVVEPLTVCADLVGDRFKEPTVGRRKRDPVERPSGGSG